ncbi:MAG: hypothetical protein JNK04_17220 [Myxococcales bacterium]|nr:hypothetical protein [Myxococcales bacterium]
MRRLSSYAIFALAIATFSPKTARAQDIGDASGTVSPPSAGRADISANRPYWGAGPVRGFAAGAFDTAGIGMRTELDLGYGRPHHQWAGLELATGLSLKGMSLMAYARAQAPWGHVRFGPRFFTGLNQKLIPEVAVVTRPLLDVNEGLRSKYLSLDGEVNVSIPLPVGALGILANAYGLFGVPDGYYVFEDALRTVVEPAFVGRGRISYLAGIGKPATLRVGGVAELIFNPGRDLYTIRTGPAVAVALTHHLEAVGVAAFSVYNPDEIGLAGADLGQIGFRYKWASGDLWPEFP